MKFRPRQQEVEAFRLGHHPEPEWFKTAIEFEWAYMYPNSVVLRTETNFIQTVFKGDWITRGYNNIPHGVSQNDFDKLYVAIEEEK